MNLQQSPAVALSHAVVTYPRISDADRAWIESVRQTHDPQFDLIRAHFTLVFPAPIPAAVLSDVVENAVGEQLSFRIEMTRAIAHWDPFSSRGYVFLVPSLGGDTIDALHQRLYEGSLRPYRRTDVPYLPHLTIAQKTSFAECLELADALSRAGLYVGAAIDQLHVVCVANTVVTSVGVFDLKHSAFGGPA
jgi:2'-5' RNA ligase